MRATTEYFFRFTNSGKPNDSLTGHGTWQHILLEAARWMARTSMHNSIRIDVGRNPFVSEEGGIDEFAKMLEEVSGVPLEQLNETDN